jgi:hypothetical protein
MSQGIRVALRGFASSREIIPSNAIMSQLNRKLLKFYVGYFFLG